MIFLGEIIWYVLYDLYTEVTRVNQSFFLYNITLCNLTDIKKNKTD